MKSSTPRLLRSVGLRTFAALALFAIPWIGCAGVPAETAPGETQAVPGVVYPIGFDDLGAPCARTVVLSETYKTDLVRCGDDGTIAAIEWLLADVVQPPKDAGPAHRLTIEERDSADPSSGGKLPSEFQILLTSNSVWMRLSRPTRRLTGFTIMALPAKLKDADLAALQARAGLASSPLLRTTEAWQAALTKGAGTPDLSKGWP